MTRKTLRRSAVAVLAASALLLVPGTGLAAAVPVPHSAPGSDVGDGASNENPKFLRLSIDSVTPNSVSVTSDPVVVVTATVTNVGDRPVHNASVRMQRAPAVDTTAGLRTSLKLDQQDYPVAGNFVRVADRLDRGQRKQFTLTMPLRPDPRHPADTPTLQIDKPGVYPLLLNVNGIPDYGSEARLDDARFLLPVLGVPAEPDAADPHNPQAKAVPAATNAPVAVTMLWPLADRPRLAAGNPGSVGDKVRLIDDDLAGELAKGGRLDSLVSSLEFALQPANDPDHKLADSVCLAVDPDLLVTVSNMARGYLVPTNASAPYGATKEGSGAAAAASWLDRVRALAKNVCTIAVPFAQVDLPSVRAVHDPQLTASAVQNPAEVADNILGTTTRRGIVWPDSGSIDDDTGSLLRASGATSVLVAGDGVAGGEAAASTPPPDVVRLPRITAPANAPAGAAAPDPALHAIPYDVSTASAFAAVGADPQTPSFAPSRTRYNLTDDSRGARLQDALGALSWTALTPKPNNPRSLLVAPPQRWSAGADEAHAILSQVSTLFRSELAFPRKLDDLVAQPPDPRPFDLNYLQHTVDDAPPQSMIGPITTQDTRINWLAETLVEDPQRELTPSRFTAPLREDLLRALSWSGRTVPAGGQERSDQGNDTDDHNRSGPGNNAADTVADRRVTQTTRTLDRLFDSVTVLAPGGVYTLASEQSPLVLVASNKLPVGIRVRIHIDAPPAMKISDVGELQLPANGTRALQLPAEVNASRNFVVHVSLTTATGHRLGDPTPVSVRSNAYGKVLAIITGCAVALLVLLVARRLWHRFRGEPDPADDEFDGPRHTIAKQRRRRRRSPRRARDRRAQVGDKATRGVS